MVSDGNLSAPSLSLLTPGTGWDQAQHFISGTVSICIHSTLCHLHWPHMPLLSSLYFPPHSNFKLCSDPHRKLFASARPTLDQEL